MSGTHCGTKPGHDEAWGQPSAIAFGSRWPAGQHFGLSACQHAPRNKHLQGLRVGKQRQQCVAPLQFANTGNLQNANAFLQFDSVADDFDGGTNTLGFAPSVSTTCDQSVQQSAAAGS